MTSSDFTRFQAHQRNKSISKGFVSSTIAGGFDVALTLVQKLHLEVSSILSCTVTLQHLQCEKYKVLAAWNVNDEKFTKCHFFGDIFKNTTPSTHDYQLTITSHLYIYIYI